MFVGGKYPRPNAWMRAGELTTLSSIRDPSSPSLQSVEVGLAGIASAVFRHVSRLPIFAAIPGIGGFAISSNL